MSSPDVVIEGVKYSLEVVPDEKTPLVQKKMKEVLGDIKLDQLVRSLDQCANFIYMAYLGTAGYPKIQTQLMMLHDDFGKTCAETDIELTNFKNQSDVVLEQIQTAGTLILAKEIDTACTILGTCSDIAGTLSKSASGLAASYTAIKEKGKKILSETIEQKDIDEDQRAKLKKLREELESQEQDNLALKDTLRQQTIFIESQFNATAEEASFASNMAFGMAITSTILTSISAGIKDVTSSMNPANMLKQFANQDPKSVDTQTADLIKQLNEKEKEKKTIEKKLDEKQEELTKSEEEVLKEEASLEKANDELEKLAKSPDAPTVDVNTAKQKVDIFTEKVKFFKEKKDQVLKVFKKVKEEFESIAADHATIKGTLDNLGKSTAKMSDNYQELAANLRKEKQKFLEMKLKSEKDEAENLSSLRKVALRIEATKQDQWNVQSAIDSLYISIGALKKVTNILNDISEFWARMKNLCDALASPRIQNNLAAFKKLEDDAYYKSIVVLKTGLVQNYAGWRAISVISKLYAEETAKVRKRVSHDFQENLTTEQSRAKACAMAQGVVFDINVDLAENGKKQLETQAEQAASKN